MDLGAYSTYSGESSPFIGQISKIATLFPWCYPCAYVELTPWAAAHQGPQSMEFSRQEYWSGLPFPPPGDFPDARIRLMSVALAGEFFTTVPIPAAAVAAAKSLQLCPTLCDPIDGSPPGSTIPGILQERTLEWVAISFSNA